MSKDELRRVASNPTGIPSQRSAASRLLAERAGAKTIPQAEPDAWLRLVLKSMSATELRREIEGGAESHTADELRWMRSELLRKEAGGR